MKSGSLCPATRGSRSPLGTGRVVRKEGYKEDERPGSERGQGGPTWVGPPVIETGVRPKTRV